MSTLFLSYRRDDSSGYAINLYDRLANRFGHDRVFMDIDQIKPGEDFHDVIHEKLKSVEVAVVLIGKHWLNIPGESSRRIDKPNDWVRLEIATLLERKIPIIPVLVGGAAMPKSIELPECLQPLARRQAHEISDNRFGTDVDKLIRILEKAISSDNTNDRTKKGYTWRAIVPGILGISIIIVVLLNYTPETRQVNDVNPVKRIETKLPEPMPIQPIAEQPQSTVSKAEAENDDEPSSEDSTSVKIIINESISKYPIVTNVHPRKKPITKHSIDTETINTEQPSIEQSKQEEQSIEKQVHESRLPFEPEMVLISPGTFLMGSPVTETNRQDNEGPQHKVTISYAFEISKYTITFNEYEIFANATGQKLPLWREYGKGRRPMYNITFNNAQTYVKWLSQQTGKKYRLLTEAEWEYAARADTQTRYWWGDDIGKNNAVCNGCGSEWDNKRVVPVGSFKANPYGLYDTAGNVEEFVQDCWHENYDNAPTDGSAWLEANGGDCNRRVVRGGLWYSDPQNLRSAYRNWSGTGRNAIIHRGFRIARDF